MTFTCLEAGRGMKILKGRAQNEEEIAPLIATMLKEQPNLLAFDHMITPAGTRFIVTIITQSQKK